MAKKNNDYFEMIKNQANYCVMASELLEEIFCSFDALKIDVYRREMHEIEHKGDDIHHDILNKLSTEFITPIDQEDIALLVKLIDDIADGLDEVIMSVYMYHIDDIPEKAKIFAKTVNRCVKALFEAVTELKSFKKRDMLHALLVKVYDIEVEADRIYTEAIHELFSSEVGVKTLIGTKVVYEGLENCCDLCDNAADIIEQVIIKNT